MPDKFSYTNAESVAHALRTLEQANGQGVIFSGGTNLMVNIYNRKLCHGHLVDISRVPGLNNITCNQSLIELGALTTLSQIAASDCLRTQAPALSMAAQVFADPITRHSATIGGNLANASPAADTAPPLLALDAQLLIAGPGYQRQLPLSQFFIDYNCTDLATDELITGVRFAPQIGSAFVKLGLRNAMAISIAAAAVSIRTDQSDQIIDCRLALGAVAPCPVRAYTAEQVLLGMNLPQGKLSANEQQRLAEALDRDIDPIDDIRASKEYRRQMARVVARRALYAAWEQLRQRRAQHD